MNIHPGDEVIHTEFKQRATFICHPVKDQHGALIRFHSRNHGWIKHIRHWLDKYERAVANKIICFGGSFDQLWWVDMHQVRKVI